MDLEKIIKLDINKKILRFFNQNPGCIDTASGISNWTGLNEQSIKAALKNLAALRILIEHSSSSTKGYSYTNNKSIINAIKTWFLKHDK